MKIKHSHYIHGKWLKGKGPHFSSLNPSDATTLWEGAFATEDEIKAAYQAAQQALFSWSQLDLAIRVEYIQRFGQQVEKKRQALTQLISQETGKPLWESATEVSSVIGKINLSIQAYQERTSTKQYANPEAMSYLRYKPHGVIAVLGPFNFPAHLSNGHIVPALLAGNTVVYKPSEQTPAVAAFMLQCWHDSGLPAGVINGIQGDASVAKILLQQAIQGVYFTGSYQAGLQIHRQFSERPDIILALEMGGNNPLIIDEIADVKAAVYHAIVSSFITAGQRCTCARRILIPDTPLGEQFLQAFIASTKTLRIDIYAKQPEPFMGPVISYQHALQHLKAQRTLQQAGGHSLLEMSLLADQTGFLSPGIIDMSKVADPMDVEIFAPIVQIYRYQHFEQAITLANQTRYGLAAGLFSDNETHYQQFYQHIRAGLINWNRPTTGASSQLPFGGIGHSGNHRPSAYFAADYCAYPIASLEQPHLILPEQSLPGLEDLQHEGL